MIRFVVLWVSICPVFLLLVTVFMPPGFSGVPYTGFVIVAFLVTFLLVALLERSVSVNVSLAFAFWASFLPLAVLSPGSAPGQSERAVESCSWIMVVALVHASVQGVVSAFVRSRARSRPEDTAE